VIGRNPVVHQLGSDVLSFPNELEVADILALSFNVFVTPDLKGN
jgi:hypothetical protein